MEFNEFVAARRSHLLRAAVLLGHSRPDAEDLVQTTLTRALRYWPSVQRADNPDAYVYRIMINTSHDQQRRRWNGEQPTETLPEVDAHPGSDFELGLAVRRALAGMSQPHRAVLVLRYFLDLSELETAETLGVATGTVKSRTSRALALLSEDPHVRSLR